MTTHPRSAEANQGEARRVLHRFNWRSKRRGVATPLGPPPETSQGCKAHKRQRRQTRSAATRPAGPAGKRGAGREKDGRRRAERSAFSMESKAMSKNGGAARCDMAARRGHCSGPSAGRRPCCPAQARRGGVARHSGHTAQRRSPGRRGRPQEEGKGEADLRVCIGQGAPCLGPAPAPTRNVAWREARGPRTAAAPGPRLAVMWPALGGAAAAGTLAVREPLAPDRAFAAECRPVALSGPFRGAPARGVGGQTPSSRKNPTTRTRPFPSW